jgi:glycosyltransferase involved in cell wall biosynthesis
MNILHLIPSIGPKSFGPGYVALNLALEQNKLGCGTQIWCFDSDEDIRWASSASTYPQKNIHGFACTFPKIIKFSQSMAKVATNMSGAQFDIIHQHGLWTGISRISYKISTSHNIPVVIAPHGTLETWALQRSKWKKRIATFFYESKNLKNAACLHATAEPEIVDFQKFGLSNPVTLIPNGATQQWLDSQGSREAFVNRFNINPNMKILLFMSRITPKKGIPLLLHAIKNNVEKFDGWALVIVGSDEFGHQAEVKKLVDELNLSSFVTFIDPIFGQTKRDAFAAANLFVLPSYSEGAPMVILDALAAGVPVITTKASPWKDLITYNCGWWVGIDLNELSCALTDAVNMSPNQLGIMGRRGKKLISSSYRWSCLAQKTLKTYNWILGKDKKPKFIFKTS